MNRYTVALTAAIVGWGAVVFWGLPRLWSGDTPRMAGYLLLVVSLGLSLAFTRLLVPDLEAQGVPRAQALGRITVLFCWMSLAAGYRWLGLGDPRELTWALTLFFPLMLGTVLGWMREEKRGEPFGLTTVWLARLLGLGLLGLLALKWQQLRLDTALLLCAALGASLVGSRSSSPHPHAEGIQGAA